MKSVLSKGAAKNFVSVCALTFVLASLRVHESVLSSLASNLREEGNIISVSGAILDSTPGQDEEDVKQYLHSKLGKSQHVLLDILAQSKKQHCDESVVVLYDLRSLLGERLVKYLEIGSHDAVSASLILRHPYRTSVLALHPCALHCASDYNSSQEEIIRASYRESSPPMACYWHSPWELRAGYPPHALPQYETFDMIFISGGHSASDVLNYYRAAEKLLRPGGFMVFDEYLNFELYPEVKFAVDQIVSFTPLRRIGVVNYTEGSSNVVGKHIGQYIFHKRGTSTPGPARSYPEVREMLCIVVCTHQRQDGSTPGNLERMWQQIQRQSYKKWRLFLTGDGYDNMTEWNGLTFISDPRVDMVNLEEPGERGKLPESLLWFTAGTKAVNMGIDRALAAGHEWIVRLDDDDLWDDDHLQNIVRGIQSNATFVMTSAQHLGGFLPPLRATMQLNLSHVSPEPCQLIQSSVAFNAKVLTSRYTISEMPGDACLWARIIFDTHFHPTYIPVDSVHHISERGSERDVYIGRKWTLNYPNRPYGWVGKNDERYVTMEYTSIVADSFPLDVSTYCTHVIGPTEGNQSFEKVSDKEIPYYIRVVPELKEMNVWTHIE